ncbi:hypothetical protein ANCCEY_11086 [Ancylostoma ceylanicum]|uniref:Uncharacterized protein n=1 Tax=Ancylostoma ceylanicum TaxID=53326 RepID=A0A0D6LIS9_9BILA|nr:hypothetical protein ANCCEY_11086 [Ancylostoma ceylanicum]
MTLNHGFPPPESIGSSEEKTSECEATADENCLRTELRAMRSLVSDLKTQIADMRQTQSTPSTEQKLRKVHKVFYCSTSWLYSKERMDSAAKSHSRAGGEHMADFVVLVTYRTVYHFTMLSGMDTRIGRLEKQLEVALNSIYTLVQLTTGMNNNVTRFREDAVDQLKGIRAHLDSVSV